MQEPLISAKRQPSAPKSGGNVGRWWEKSRLAFFTVMLLVTSVGNTVYFKRMTNAMPNYGWYLTQLSSLMYVPLFLIIAGPGIFLQTKQELVWRFAIMGVCDGLSGTLMVLGGVHTSGGMQVLLSQAVIPLTMVFSLAWIGKRFHMLQQLGAVVIVMGIVLAKAGTRGSSDADMVVFNFIYLVGIVPSALSSVFKEVAFRGFDGDLDVNVLQFFVAAFQVVVNFCAMPIYTLKVLGVQRVHLEDMLALAVGGTRCLFFLEDQVLQDCGVPGERPCDHCHDAWVPVMSYLAFNLFFNIFTVQVIKHGSATLSFLVSTLRMPLSSLAFSSTLIMGSEAQAFGMSDLISLVVILSGLIAYRVGARLQQRRQHRSEDAPPMSPVWPSPSETASAALKRGVSRRWHLAPLFSTGLPGLQPTFVLVRDPPPQPRSAERVRSDLYRRLGAASPLHSPRLRDRSPGTPPSGAGLWSPQTGCGPWSPSSQQASPPSTIIADSEEPEGEIAIVGLPPQA